jgi:hypothetical protein
MAKCDICGKQSAIYDMADLRDIYQTDGIRSMCRSCEQWANDELWKIRAENDKTFKARLCERAGRKQGVGWVKRIFEHKCHFSETGQWSNKGVGIEGRCKCGKTTNLPC